MLVSRIAAGLAGLLLAAVPAAAQSIGVNFQGGGGPAPSPAAALAPTDSAGVVPQSNFNNFTGGSGTNLALIDGAGAATSATLTFASGGTYGTSGSTPATGDEKLNQGFIYGNGTVTVSNVPYAQYEVYVYQLNDAAGRVQTTSLTAGGPAQTFYGAAASPSDAGHVDGNAATPYVYTQATSVDLANPTPNADYVRFTGLTGSSFTFTTSAPGNGYLNGFQIVNASPVPEPASLGLLGLGALGLLARRRRVR